MKEAIEEAAPITTRGWKLALLAMLWAGGLCFGAYMFVTYLWSGGHQQFALWNTLLGNLYVPDRVLATAGIGIHIIAGSTIALLGPIQLLPYVRKHYPGYHRAAGKIYLTAALAACIGGNAFILINGTVGGTVMSIGFSLYGVLLGVCAIQAGRMAYQGDFEAHRRWALRLFVLGIGPLLYRIEYGLWALCAQGLHGHTNDWQGPLDYVMDFFFYIPNLLVIEVYLRLDRRPESSQAKKLLFPITAGALLVAIALGLVLVIPNWWYPVAHKVWLQIP